MRPTTAIIFKIPCALGSLLFASAVALAQQPESAIEEIPTATLNAPGTRSGKPVSSHALTKPSEESTEAHAFISDMVDSSGQPIVTASFLQQEGEAPAQELEPLQQPGPEQTGPEQTAPQQPDQQPNQPPQPQQTDQTPGDQGGLGGLSALRRSRAAGPATGLLTGSEAFQYPATDAGGLLGKSGVTGISFQQRNPTVTDVRTRGNHVGQLTASGSYWVPARADLDTMLSKIDSRLIDDMIIIKGPYSALYGPGFNFIDFSLLPAPRAPGGFDSGGSTLAEYQTNGARSYGRQSGWVAGEDYGFRIGYGHKTGNDYATGGSSGTTFDIPASYNSRDVEVAIGLDLTRDDHIEFHYLRLDQTDVEYPGMVFDMNFLVTDAFDVEYIAENRREFDRFTLAAWYNRTRFAGDTFGAGKNRQIPTLRCNLFPFDGSGNPDSIDDCILDPGSGVGEAITNVAAMTTGFKSLLTWGDNSAPRLSLGTDFRYIDRALNDIEILRPPESNNFPIPPCDLANPGLLVEYAVPVSSEMTVRTGGRLDVVFTNAENVVPGVGETTVTPGVPDPTFTGTPELITDRLNTDSLDRNFTLWSFFLTGERELTDSTMLTGGFGFAQRAPTLTELYSAGAFINLLQSGLTTLLGDPDLRKEQLAQLDIGLNFSCDIARGRISGYYSWIEDYITFDVDDEELTEEQIGQKGNLVTLVNTERATIAGFELFGECDLTNRLVAFASMTYLEGRDHTRRSPSRFRGVGDRSGATHEKEPLPNIAPLDSILGLRLHSQPWQRPWSLELTARIVDTQDRVAFSLFERETAGFTVLNLRGYCQATDRLQLTAGVENLNNKFYREHLDYRAGLGVFQPGANFYFGSELSY